MSRLLARGSCKAPVAHFLRADNNSITNVRIDGRMRVPFADQVSHLRAAPVDVATAVPSLGYAPWWGKGLGRRSRLVVRVAGVAAVDKSPRSRLNGLHTREIVRQNELKFVPVAQASLRCSNGVLHRSRVHYIPSKRR